MNSNRDSFWGIDLFGCATAVVAAFCVVILLMSIFEGEEGGGVETIEMEVVVTLTQIPYVEYETPYPIATRLPVRGLPNAKTIPLDDFQPMSCTQAVTLGWTQEKAGEFRILDKDGDGLGCEHVLPRVTENETPDAVPTDACPYNNYCCINPNLTCKSHQDFVRGWCDYAVHNATGAVAPGTSHNECYWELAGWRPPYKPSSESTPELVKHTGSRETSLNSNSSCDRYTEYYGASGIDVKVVPAGSDPPANPNNRPNTFGEADKSGWDLIERGVSC